MPFRQLKSFLKILIGVQYETKSPGIGFVNLTLPIPGFASVVGLAAGGLPGHRVQAAPGIPFCGIQLPFLLFGELFVGNHGIILLDFRVL